MTRVVHDNNGRLLPMGEVKSAEPKGRLAANLRKLHELRRAYTDIRQTLSGESPVTYPIRSCRTLPVESAPTSTDDLERRWERDTNG